MMPRAPVWASMLLLLCLLPATTSKTVTGTLDPHEEFQYVGKFTFGAGSNKMAFRVPPALLNKNAHVVLYMDEVWDEVRTATTCEHQKQERLRGQHNTELVSSNVMPKEVALAHTEGLVEVQHHLEIAMRSYYYYVAVVRCENPNDPWFLPGADDARFELEFRNGDSHFSADEAGMCTWTLFCLAVLVGVSCIAGKQLGDTGGATTSGLLGRFHPVVRVLIGASVLHGASMVCQLAHYVAYSSNGYGWAWIPFQTASLILHEAVKLVLTTLFIVISQGWTINTDVLPKSGVLFCIVGSTFLFECFGLVIQAVYAESHDAYSSRAREGSVGLILVLMQLGLYGWFLKGVMGCISTESKRMSQRHGFFLSFAVCCSLWFLAEPVLVLISTFVANYIRQRLLLGGALLFQTLALCSVSWLFLGRSTFSKISTMGADLLPSSGHRYTQHSAHAG